MRSVGGERRRDEARRNGNGMKDGAIGETGLSLHDKQSSTSYAGARIENVVMNFVLLVIGWSGSPSPTTRRHIKSVRRGEQRSE